MDTSTKLKIGFISNSPLIKTGLARNIKALLPILYKTNKYEIFLLNQSMGDGDPNYQRFPWNNEGCMKNFDQQKFNSDPNYQRYVSYGNSAVEDWVVRNKLDCVIALDDGWAFDIQTYLKSDWYNHMKQNFIFGITIDSEPVLPHIKELAKECPNFCSWAQFGEKRLKEEDIKLYGHVKTLRGAIDSDEFKPLSNHERLQLRHKFNIKDDEKIIMFLGRNQLRKNAFYANQEALAEFKKKHPEKKVKLLFHTKFNEPNGWPIDLIREELKLPKEDILCTYFCRNCQDWTVQHFDGDDIDCKHCGSQKSKTTAGIDSSINEKDLNKIYNICNAACSVFTSGGQEYFNVESLLSGLPLACADYSCGQDFCEQPFVFPIKGTFTREHNTSFKKFVPNIQNIIEFYEYIYSLDDKTKRQITNTGREWAAKEFDARSIANQIQKFVDSKEKINWEEFLNRKKEKKDPNAQIPEIQDNAQWLKTLYKEILKMEVKDDDSGLQFWVSELNNRKRTRQDVDNYFRNVGQQENIKNNQVQFQSLLLDNGKKHFLLVAKESAGDILYASAILRSLRASYPSNEWNIYFACDPQFSELLDCNPNVDRVINYQPFMEQEIHCTGSGKNKGMFDGYCFLTTNTQRHLSYLTNNNVGLIYKIRETSNPIGETTRNFTNFEKSL